MTEAVRASFRVQAQACAALGSPLTARILRLLAEGQSLVKPDEGPRTGLLNEALKGELVVRRYDKPKSLD